MLAIIKLVRHGESLANTRELEPRHVGDFSIPLSPKGEEQAKAAGEKIGRKFVNDSLCYCSPYKRTRQTMAGIMKGCRFSGPPKKVYEEPRLREVDRGYESDAEQLKARKQHGWFYYRFKGGESPADGYDRASTFLESLGRQIERKPQLTKVLIVTHGLFIRCFVMRFMHMTVEEFDAIDNPDNASVVTIRPDWENPDDDTEPYAKNGKWRVYGLKKRE